MASHRALFAAALLLAAASCAHGLSWPLCDAGGQVWVTERPRTEPGVIGANLWFFCESGLNILGVSVSPCICNGTVCSPAVADAICQAFGFDEAWSEEMGGEGPTITNATLQEPVRSLTGEFCLRKGVYAQSVPNNLAEMGGEPCDKIDGITCIRQRSTIITALDASNLAAFEPAPPAAEPAVPAGSMVSVEDQRKAVQMAEADGGGARKLLK